MQKLIFGLLCVVAVIFIIGSACAWSNGNIGIGQMLIQVAIGLAVEWFALKNMDM